MRTLGEGGMGVVYEAIDHERKTRVALKTLRALDVEARTRFKNEFRALQDIQHPNLVALGELFEESGQLFFSMELVSGVDFFQYVRPHDASEGARAPASLIPDDEITAGPKSTARPRDSMFPRMRRRGKAFDEAKLRSAFGQLAQGIHALHRAHKVHRDIKPSNVIVTQEGRVVILDFGLIMDVTRAGSDNSIVGTAHFMAPEQAAAKPVGPAADWYSMGVMLYLALTGCYPFQLAPEVALDFKQRVEPPPPGVITPGLPPDLESLTIDLLRLEATARPQGRDVLRRLEVDEEIEPALLQQSTGFVGRRRELAMLYAAFIEARRGNAMTMLVEGESGMGKSVLVRRFLERIRSEAMIFAGRCYERESVPYKALDEIIEELSQHLMELPRSELESVLPPNAPLLATVFPILRKIETLSRGARPAPRTIPPPGKTGTSSIPPPRDMVDPIQMRTQGFMALRELLQNLATKRPIVLAIDDLQWADADSLALLMEIMRPPSAPPLLLVATIRTGLEPSSNRSQVFFHPSGAVRYLKIRNLPPDEALELVKLLLREAGPSAMLDAQALVHEAGGHPMFIDALVRHRITYDDAGEGVRLDDVLWSRIQRLDTPVRQLLELSVVAGGPLHREVAALALDTEQSDVVRRASVLRGHHLARVSGAGVDESIEPFHDRIRETVEIRIDHALRQHWHIRLALSLEASGRAEFEELAVHWRNAGDPKRASGYAERAGDKAVEALAFDRAARLYRMALDLHQPTGFEGRLLVTKLGDALANAGRGAEAAEAYLGAMYDASPAEALDLGRRAAESLLRCGYIDEGLAGLSSVLSAMGIDVPKTRDEALASLSMRRKELRERGHDFEERRASELDETTLAKIDVCWSAALGLAMVDPVRGADFLTRGLLFALEAGEPYRVACTMSLEAAFVATGGSKKRGRAASLLRTASLAAERSEHPHALGLVEGVTGVARFFDGQWRKSLSAFDRAELIFREHCGGVPWERGSVSTFGVWALWFLGDVREFARRTPLYLREAEERGDRFLATNLRSGFSNSYWLLLDDMVGARREANGAMRQWSSSELFLQHCLDLIAKAHIALYTGDVMAARRYLEETWDELSSSLMIRMQLVRVTMWWLRGRLSLAAGGEGAVAASMDAARVIEAERLGWGDALAAVLRAGALTMEGSLEEAGHYWEAALGGFEGAEMALFLAAARRRYGEILQGSIGKPLIEQANRWMKEQGIVNPERITNMLMPKAGEQTQKPTRVG